MESYATNIIRLPQVILFKSLLFTTISISLGLTVKFTIALKNLYRFIQKNQSTFLLSASAYDSDKVSEGKGKGKDD